MIDRLPRPGSTSVRPALIATAFLAMLTLGACGSSSSGASSSGGASTSPSGAGASGAGGSRAGGPAAAGTIAAMSGTTMQVQSQQNGQVAVSWTSSTKFSHMVSTTLSAIKAGDCVLATAPTGTSASASSFTAQTLLVSAPVNGACSGGFGGGGNGQRPAGAGGNSPRPSGRPSGAPGGGGFGTVASGKVSTVSGSTLIVAAQQRGSGSTTTKNVTVTVGSSTKATTGAATTSSSLKVGKCVTAQGKADSTGTVAATTVTISDATNGQCTSGFGRGAANGG